MEHLEQQPALTTTKIQKPVKNEENWRQKQLSESDLTFEPIQSESLLVSDCNYQSPAGQSGIELPRDTSKRVEFGSRSCRYSEERIRQDTSAAEEKIMKNDAHQMVCEPTSQTTAQTPAGKDDNSDNVSASKQQADATPTAGSTKPARRRRLAHRRQYTKSRRLASSYMRSQFVRYDSLIDSASELSSSATVGNETATHNNDWTTMSSGALLSSREDDVDNDAASSLQTLIDQNEYYHANHRHRGRSSAPNTNAMRHLYSNRASDFVLTSMPNTSIEDNSESRQAIFPCTCAQIDQNRASDEIQYRLEAVDCSSSSLDSFSPMALPGDSSQNRSATTTGSNKRGINSSMNRSQALAPSMALSLGSLANLYSGSSTPVDQPQRILSPANPTKTSATPNILAQQQQHHSDRANQHIRVEPSCNRYNRLDQADRVVRSETADHLSRSRLPSESPKSKFFPSNERLVQVDAHTPQHSQQQQQHQYPYSHSHPHSNQTAITDNLYSPSRQHAQLTSIPSGSISSSSFKNSNTISSNIASSSTQLQRSKGPQNRIGLLNTCPLHHSVEQITPPARCRTNTSVTTTAPVREAPRISIECV